MSDIEEMKDIIRGEMKDMIKGQMQGMTEKLMFEITTQGRVMETRFAQLNQRFAQQGGQLEQLLAATLAPKGDEVAKTVTVTIKEEGSTPQGHGLFYTIPAEGGDRYFILSAGHVVVHFDAEKPLQIEWKPWDGTALVKLKLKNLFLKEDYIKTGRSDVGLAEVEFVTASDLDRLQKKIIVLALPNVEVGQTMVGHSSIYLRGPFLGPCEGQGARRLVNTPSMPGVSGCPLFDSKERLFALVHGCSKHRHSRGDDNVSPYLYADVPYGAAGLRQVSSDPGHRNILQWGEELDSDLAKDSSSEYNLDADDCPTFITRLAPMLDPQVQRNSLHSVDSLMGQLAEICLPQEGDTIFIPKTMTCLILDETATGAPRNNDKETVSEKPHVVSPYKGA
jgi:hypothetical protein